MIRSTKTASSERPQDVTLLELVTALAKIIDSPEEIRSHARDMIESGTVRLRGNFRGAQHLLLGQPAPSGMH